MSSTRNIVLIGILLHCAGSRAHAINDFVRNADSVDHSGAQSVVEPFPILSYDSDTGFGYGGKLVILNQLGARESFDLTLYGSTRGERWYRFAFSVPDRELRQGTAYPMALDVVVDYDKWISSSFFGIGSRSPFASKEVYTKEVFDASLSISRGFTPELVAEAMIRWNGVRASNLDPAGQLNTILAAANAREVGQLSAVLSLRYDSRDDFIEPTEGSVIASWQKGHWTGIDSSIDTPGRFSGTCRSLPVNLPSGFSRSGSTATVYLLCCFLPSAESIPCEEPSWTGSSTRGWPS
jgi:hypothetical protein